MSVQATKQIGGRSRLSVALIGIGLSAVFFGVTLLLTIPNSQGAPITLLKGAAKSDASGAWRFGMHQGEFVYRTVDNPPPPTAIQDEYYQVSIFFVRYTLETIELLPTAVTNAPPYPSNQRRIYTTFIPIWLPATATIILGMTVLAVATRRGRKLTPRMAAS